MEIVHFVSIFDKFDKFEKILEASNPYISHFRALKCPFCIEITVSNFDKFNNYSIYRIVLAEASLINFLLSVLNGNSHLPVSAGVC